MESGGLGHLVDLDAVGVGDHDELVIELVPEYLSGLGLEFKDAQLSQSEQVQHHNAGVLSPAILASGQLPSMAVDDLLHSFDGKLSL